MMKNYPSMPHNPSRGENTAGLDPPQRPRHVLRRECISQAAQRKSEGHNTTTKSVKLFDICDGHRYNPLQRGRPRRLM